jgi:hypothetical protein
LKVKIINKDGVETAIDPATLVVNSTTLADILKRLLTLENKLTSLTKQLADKDAKLSAAMRKL